MKVLVVGSLTVDEIHIGGRSIKQMGGGACYSSIASARMGCTTVVQTIIGRDFPKEWLKTLEEESIEVVYEEGESSTAFINIYRDDMRIQYLNSFSGVISNIPTVSFDVSHITPVFHEVPLSILERVSSRVCSVDVQGYVRRADHEGRIYGVKWKPDKKYLKEIDILHFSDDEQPYLDLQDPLLLENVRVICFTHGADGASILTSGERYTVPSYPTKHVDPTGAGDVFSVVFAIAVAEGYDFYDAGLLASAAASLLVEEWGWKNIEKNKVFTRYKELRERFPPP